MELLKIIFLGYVILINAIILNIIANKLNIITWYQFLKNISNKGFLNTLKQLNIFSILFLFILYPFILGLISYQLIKIM